MENILSQTGYLKGASIRGWSVVIALDEQNSNYMVRKLHEDYKSWGPDQQWTKYTKRTTKEFNSISQNVSVFYFIIFKIIFNIYVTLVIVFKHLEFAHTL